ncbi:MAG TPA: type III pantothenate kinase [Burkholderiaceae bacterium]|jgi:type III pantothenate kinase|nr:type III pantothenate kinase [Burkholderiaceae bacterium]
MTWLLLDAGNTALKWALTGPNEPDALARGILGLGADFAGTLAGTLKASLLGLPPGVAAAPQAIGCSVASDAVTRAIAMAVGPLVSGGVRWLSSEPRFEHGGVALVNGYRDPGQLGTDRWHAMIAARQSFPRQPLVVVCAGTATTVDSVDSAGRFLGGAIAPGTSLMADSLARGTARLPRSTGRPVAMPDNTDDAIATGVADALAGLVERRVRALARAAGSPPQLVLAGGRVGELASRLWLGGQVAGIMIEEHLVLRGLWLRASADSAAGASQPDPR